MTVDLGNLTFGETCTYNVRSKCGFPQIEVNSSDVDMIVSYKKDHWDKNETFKPDHHDKYEKGEVFNPKCNKTAHDGKASFKMPKKDKKDKNDKEC